MYQQSPLRDRDRRLRAPSTNYARSFRSRRRVRCLRIHKLAEEHEEVLLQVLAVVQAIGLTGHQHPHVDSHLPESVFPFEPASSTELLVTEPSGVAEVDGEPTRGRSNETRRRIFELRFRCHGARVVRAPPNDQGTRGYGKSLSTARTGEPSQPTRGSGKAISS